MGELSFGSGHALFGSMTATDFHSPRPDALKLRANTISYLASFDGEPEATPEPASVFTLVVIGALGANSMLKRK